MNDKYKRLYLVAMSIGRDVGNAHARMNGRDVWDESDWDEACKTTKNVLNSMTQDLQEEKQ